MRGLTQDERDMLRSHVDGSAPPEVVVDYDAANALFDGLARQRRLVVTHGRHLDGGDEYIETKITETGRLALRVCPP